jgi:hypothetical protein
VPISSCDVSNVTSMHKIMPQRVNYMLAEVFPKQYGRDNVLDGSKSILADLQKGDPLFAWNVSALL